MRLGIAGISGRVGRLLVEQARQTEVELVGGIVGRSAPDQVDAGIRLFDGIEALAAHAQVVIDFSHPDAAERHAHALAECRVAWILGTTGISAQAQHAVRAAARRIAVVQAANFSPGVALVLDLAARMAAALPSAQYDAEILEMHHRQKIDAPSGTALAIGRAVVEGRGGGTVPEESGRHGQTGPRTPGAIGYAALRGGQVVGEHTLLFTSAGEQISLVHRAFDRGVFAAGALRAAFWAASQPPGLYDMRDVLGLT